MRRREFLTAAAAAATVTAQTAAGGPIVAGLEADRPRGEARLFPGCCAYSYLKHFNTGAMTMETFIRKAVELEAHSIDITTYWLTSAEPEYLSSLRHLAFKNGLAFSGIAIRTEMCQGGGAIRAEEVRRIHQWVDATQLLGAPHIRVFGGNVPEGVSEKQGISWVAETMKRACEYAAKFGITLGIENHGGVTARASAVLETLRQVDSPYAGVNLDIANFEGKTDEEMYADIQACVPYATHAHIRDTFGSTKRPIDLDRAWRIFADGGYKGYMSAEYEAEEDPNTGVPKLMEKIRTLCRKYSSA